MLDTTDKIIKHKTGLLNLAEELGNVSKACQVMGYSRDTFYLTPRLDGVASLKTARPHAWFRTGTTSLVVRYRKGRFDLKSRCGRHLCKLKSQGGCCAA